MSTAVADVSGLLEVASAPSVPQPPVEETPLETTEVETPEAGEGAEKTTPEKDAVDGRTNPDAIRKALKAWRDSSPDNAPVARKLNYIVGHEKAYTEVWPTVAKAKEAKFLLDSIGGGEGLTSLQNTIKSVNETDALLYAGDPKVLDSILEDMKKAGKVEAFGKLASPFLDKLRATDEKAYFAALRPHFFQGIQESGLPDVLDGLEEALAAQVDGKPVANVDLVKRLVGEMRKWYGNLSKTAAPAKDPELDRQRQEFDKERTTFQSEKQKAFQAEVHGEWNKINNQVLGAALKPYLALPFAKNWTDATKKSVGGQIVRNLLAELDGDKTYQSHMDGSWSESKPDKAKILAFHKDKVNLIGKRVVDDTLNALYPGFASVKTPKPVVAAAPAAVTGRPTFQSSKPATGDPTIDWDRTTDVMYATGRFYKKGEKVPRTWNPKYK